MNFGKVKFIYLMLTIILLISQSCIISNVEKEKKKNSFSDNTPIDVRSIHLENHRFTITGGSLHNVKSITVTDGGALNQDLLILSQSVGEIVAATPNPVSFALATAYNLIFTDAYGQSPSTFTFTLNPGDVTNAIISDYAVTGEKISDMGAADGDVIKWDSVAGRWIPAADVGAGAGGGTVTNVTRGRGFVGTGQSITVAGVIDIDTGTEPNSIVEIDSTGNLVMPVGVKLNFLDTISYPATQEFSIFNDGSLRIYDETNTANKITVNGGAGDVDVNSTLNVTGGNLQVSGVNVCLSDGTDCPAAGAAIDDVVMGTGLIAGTVISGTATINVDVGYNAGQIVQVQAGGIISFPSTIMASGGGKFSLEDVFATQTYSLDTNAGSFRIYDETNTATRMEVQTDGDVNFNANTLFISASTNKVGIGTNLPDQLLHVEANDSLINAISYPLRLTHTTTGVAGQNIGVGVEFEIESGAGNNVVASAIETILTDVLDTSEESALIFKTADMGDDNLAERMRIDQNGYVGVGTTTMGARVTVEGEIQLSTSGMACDTTKKGSIRFNTSTDVFESCNGTLWSTLDSGGTLTAVTRGRGLLGNGTTINTTGVIDVKTGTAPNDIVEFDGTGNLVLANTNKLNFLDTSSYPATQEFSIYNDGSWRLYDETNTAVRMTMDNSGDATFHKDVSVLGTALTVNGKNVCLDDGTNCPTAAGDAIDDIVYGTGLVAGTVLNGTATINVDVGTSAGQIVQVQAGGIISHPSTIMASSGGKFSIENSGAAQTYSLDTSGTSFRIYDETNTASRFEIENDGDINFDSGSMFLDATSGYVGIGTTTPSDNLHVIGNVRADRYYFDNSGTYLDRPAGTTRLRTSGGLDVTGGEDSFIRSGNVGIGTTTASALLTVAGTATVTGVASFSNIVNVGGQDLNLRHDDGRVNFGNSTASGKWSVGISSAANDDFMIMENGGSKTPLLIDDTTFNMQLNPDNGGYVAVGTTTFGAPLTVGGEIQIADTGMACDTTKKGSIRWNNTSGYLESCDGSAWTQLGTGGTVIAVGRGRGISGEGTTITLSGVIDVNTGTAPNDIVEFDGTSNLVLANTNKLNFLDTSSYPATQEFSIYNDGSWRLYDQTNTAVRMTVDSSGDATFHQDVSVLGTGLTVNGSAVCLADGSNCPTAAGDAIDDIIYGTGLVAGTVLSGTATINVDVGTTSGQIVQVQAGDIISFPSTIMASGGGKFSIENSGAAQAYSLDTSGTSFRIYDETNTASRFEIENDGDINLASGTMFINAASGFVGIGTTTPTYPLVVKGAGSYIQEWRSSADAQVLRMTDAGELGYNVSIENLIFANAFSLKGVSGAGLYTNGAVTELRANTAMPIVSGAFNVDTIIQPTRTGNTNGFGDVGVNVNGARALTVRNTTGYVGIGTTTPDALLTVVGTATISGEANFSSIVNVDGQDLNLRHDDGRVNFGNSTASGKWSVGISSAANDDFMIMENGGSKTPLLIDDTTFNMQLNPDNGGYVGIGTTTFGAMLTVGGEVQVSTTGLTCDTTTKGSIRYNDTSSKLEYCNGTAWTTADSGGTITQIDRGRGLSSSGTSITTSGAIDVNTGTAPNNIVEIDGTGDLVLTSDVKLQLLNTSSFPSTQAFSIYNDGSWRLYDETNTAVRMTVDNTGDLTVNQDVSILGTGLTVNGTAVCLADGTNCSGAAGDAIDDIIYGTGLVAGTVLSGTATISVDVGTASGQIVEVWAGGIISHPSTIMASSGGKFSIENSGAAQSYSLDTSGTSFRIYDETNTAARMEVQNDGDVAFDTDTLFVDATSNTVGIRQNAAMASALSVTGSMTLNATAGFGVVASFLGEDTTGADADTRVLIKDTTGNIDWYLSANDNGSFSLNEGGATDHFSIFKTSGYVSIGTTTEGVPLSVGGEIQVASTGLACDTTKKGSIRYNDGASYLESCDGSSWAQLGTGGTVTSVARGRGVSNSGTSITTTGTIDVDTGTAPNNIVEIDGTGDLVLTSDVKLQLLNTSSFPSTQAFSIYNDGSWRLYDETNTAVRMTVDNTGDLTVNQDVSILGTGLTVNGTAVCLADGTNCSGAAGDAIDDIIYGTGLVAGTVLSGTATISVDVGTASGQIVEVWAGGIISHPNTIMASSGGKFSIENSGAAQSYSLDTSGTSFRIYDETNTTTRMEVQNDGDVAFNTDTLFINATSGYVGIGTTTLNSKLVVEGEVQVTNSGNGCSTTNKGSMRYESSTNVMQFCNGTTWTTFGGGTLSCTTVTDGFNGCGGADTSPLADATCGAGYTITGGSCTNATATGQLVESKINGNGWACRWSGHDGNCATATAICCKVQ